MKALMHSGTGRFFVAVSALSAYTFFGAKLVNNLNSPWYQSDLGLGYYNSLPFVWLFGYHIIVHACAPKVDMDVLETHKPSPSSLNTLMIFVLGLIPFFLFMMVVYTIAEKFLDGVPGGWWQNPNNNIFWTVCLSWLLGCFIIFHNKNEKQEDA